MANNFPRIRAAAVDERAHNVFYRMTQLERLCKTLIDKADSIREAISSDYGHSQAEIAVEFNLAIKAIEGSYASLKPEKALQEEYLIANGKDAPSNRKPAGIVYIEPTTHTLFYSVLVPLASAIAAGNCVIVLVRNVSSEWLQQPTNRCS
jgi:acyl-CoA reductase-like NAD-dependent aldehyde dehydrogenase